MQKEKKVRTYQRRTKTGKLVTVRQHTAKYDAAEAMKEAAKKKGAGEELATKKKAKPTSAEGMDFSQADFKAWYHWDQENDPKNPAALKVEKALKAKMGAKGYRKFFNDMSDSYSARGHLKAYKECQSCGDKGESKSTKTTKVKEPKTSKSVDTPKGSAKGTRMKGEKEGERDSYYGTGTLDAKYAEAVKAAKSGDVRAYRKAVGAYSEVYSHHGDHFEDRASMNYREKQTKVLEGLASKMGVDYWGYKPKKEVDPKVEKNRRKQKIAKACEKAGITIQELKAFMKRTPQKWTYNRMGDDFYTDRDSSGKKAPRNIRHLSVESAIKQMQKAQGKMDSPKSSEKTTKESPKDLQSKIDTLKEKAGYRKKGVSFHVIGSSGKYSVILDGGRTMDKTFKTKREAQEALVGELTKMTEEAKPKVGPRRKASSPTQSRPSKGPKLPAHYVNRYKKEMSKLPESEWEKFF